jgi:hypothetical protein
LRLLLLLLVCAVCVAATAEGSPVARDELANWILTM